MKRPEHLEVYNGNNKFSFVNVTIWLNYYVLSVVLATTKSSRLFSLNTTKIPLAIIRKIPINEFISGISEKIIIPIIIAKIRCTYSAILFTNGEPTL